jgi:hypothetical protein
MQKGMGQESRERKRELGLEMESAALARLPSPEAELLVCAPTQHWASNPLIISAHGCCDGRA